MYGLQLVAASRRRLKRGTVYVTLGRMVEKAILSRLEPAPIRPAPITRIARRTRRVAGRSRWLVVVYVLHACSVSVGTCGVWAD